MIAGIILGSVVFLIFVGILTYCIIRRKRKNKKAAELQELMEENDQIMDENYKMEE